MVKTWFLSRVDGIKSHEAYLSRRNCHESLCKQKNVIFDMLLVRWYIKQETDNGHNKFRLSRSTYQQELIGLYCAAMPKDSICSLCWILAVHVWIINCFVTYCKNISRSSMTFCRNSRILVQYILFYLFIHFKCLFLYCVHDFTQTCRGNLHDGVGCTQWNQCICNSSQTKQAVAA